MRRWGAQPPAKQSIVKIAGDTGMGVRLGTRQGACGGQRTPAPHAGATQRWRRRPRCRPWLTCTLPKYPAKAPQCEQGLALAKAGLCWGCCLAWISTGADSNNRARNLISAPA